MCCFKPDAGEPDRSGAAGAEEDRLRGLTCAAKRAGENAFNTGDGVVNWFPGHMADSSRAIQNRLELADFVNEVRDADVSSPLTLSFDLLCRRHIVVIARGPKGVLWVLLLAL